MYCTVCTVLLSYRTGVDLVSHLTHGRRLSCSGGSNDWIDVAKARPAPGAASATCRELLPPSFASLAEFKGEGSRFPDAASWRVLAGRAARAGYGEPDARIRAADDFAASSPPLVGPYAAPAS